MQGSRSLEPMRQKKKFREGAAPLKKHSHFKPSRIQEEDDAIIGTYDSDWDTPAGDSRDLDEV